MSGETAREQGMATYGNDSQRARNIKVDGSIPSGGSRCDQHVCGPGDHFGAVRLAAEACTRAARSPLSSISATRVTAYCFSSFAAST